MHHHDEKIGLLDLRQQLQKTFSVIRHCRNGFKETEAISRPCLKTMVNLTEQFQCCSAVSETSLPTNIDFYEVKQKLLFKISTEINESVEKLHHQICKYAEYTNRMRTQYDQCMSTYINKCSSPEHLHQLLERSPLYPSITDMLDWIEVSQRVMRETYLCKKFIVDTFTPDQPGICDSLESSWKEGDSDLYDKLDEYIALTNKFMELEIS